MVVDYQNAIQMMTMLFHSPAMSKVSGVIESTDERAGLIISSRKEWDEDFEQLIYHKIYIL
jgi:hypothetical protein